MPDDPARRYSFRHPGKSLSAAGIGRQSAKESDPLKRKITIKVKSGKFPPVSFGHCNTDPMGMYTGVPLDEDEEPVQDADDL